MDRVLALFAEGIAGRAYHIKSLAELGGEADADGGVSASHDGASLYLPDAIELFEDERLNAAMYRLTVLEQLGFREFGTYRFDVNTAWRRLPSLAGRAPEAGLRDSDLGVFFNCFALPGVARALFHIVEGARVRAAVARRYPGTRRYQRALRDRWASRGQPDDALATPGGVAAELASLRAALAELDPEAATAKPPATASRLVPLVAGVLAPAADVYTSAAATAACFDALDITLEAASGELAANDDGPAMEWLQREVRLEDWQREFANLEGEIAALEFAANDGEAVPAGAASEAGELREVDVDLVAERERLKRRIDMERSAVRWALGEERGGRASFRYPEWDFHLADYRRGWCRLYEEPLQAEPAALGDALLDAVRPYARAVRRQFEQVRPGGYQRVKKTPDGDELDLDAVVETRADIRAGTSPDERVYSRRDRLRRDVAAALLVDLSASTDDVIPEERETGADAAMPEQDFRDPFFDDGEYDFAERMAAEAAKRRIIDIQREAVLLMATALEGLGDRYGVYGFSGYGRECVEFYIAKEIEQPFDSRVLGAIAAMKPKRSTRMGPAVRHAAVKLEASGAAQRVLLIVSDGFPQDHDYGPDRGDHEYGVQDTARALMEAQARGIETFCVTVDRSGHDYLRRMCPDHRYMVIEETGELPAALQKAYRQLTRF